MIWPIMRLILVAFRFVPNRYKLRFLLFAFPFLVERFRRSRPRTRSGSGRRGCGCCLPIVAATGSAIIFLMRRFARRQG